MKLIKEFENLEQFVAKNDLKSLVAGICDENGNELSVPTSKELAKWLEDNNDKGKKLKLGIVGRVKAGKSSLLNAIFFSGKDILPKAATPMTAALTLLSYDENFSASAEFFTQEDIEALKQEHSIYEKELREKIEAKFQELKGKATSQNSQKSDDELRESAQTSIEREMRKTTLYASFEQYEKIKQSMLGVNDLKAEIMTSSLEELQDILKDYVGESGKYMPFTKATTLNLNIDSLKDIQIIDSPGINDPIVSREERTKKLLKDCDAVFLISPAGQFLSAEDLSLLDRISDKEGIAEFTIIASQADNQLFGSAKDKANGVLSEASEYNRQDLSAHLKKTMLDFKAQRSSQSVKNTCDKLANSPVILSSAACFSMLESFDNKASWDSNLQKIWDNLNEDYKDYFSDASSAKENLKLIANIDKVKERLDEVRANKKQILETKKNEYLQAKIKTLADYTKGIEQIINDRIEELNSKDLEQISKQISELKKKKADTTVFVDDAYDDLCADFITDLKDELKSSKKSYFKEGKGSIKDNKDTGTESYEASTSKWYKFWTWGRTERKTREFQIIYAGDVRNALEEMISNLQDLLNDEIKKRSRTWKSALLSKLVSVLREHLGDDNIDTASIVRIIKNIINSLPKPDVDYSDALPSDLHKSGKLTEYAAERFIDDATEFVSDFSSEVEEDIRELCSKLETNLKKIKIADEIFKGYEAELSKLENELKNKKLSLDKYDKMLKDLENIAKEVR
ncbi:hypothetical protein LS71_007885 [Helicobacter jaachi]|uniref:Dynamin N-terminal domain-containing protein n=1 Tax=Helicobacter jaachi TaxID=1677920 RepID=A0A4U8T838_9HELI|nr:dynamin family protein [Helicobacter jaachi]TLD95753.1 hypothetical protein LS71_007885 [Helicobacter jaachi]